MEGNVGRPFRGLKLEKAAARDHQKSYADNRRKLLEFEVEDQVLLKVDKTLHFVEEPVEIMDREVKSLKRRDVELRRWFEKTEMTFRISECAKDKKVKFAAAILQGPALTWWNSKVAILGLDVANQIRWTKMKKLMTTEFCPTKELQRMKNELWNLKVKEYNMVTYTQRFNELSLMCPRMVKP
ncbi:putative reverse transcriptase domain-containing protein [Tanacetum coccineum]